MLVIDGSAAADRPDLGTVPWFAGIVHSAVTNNVDAASALSAIVSKMLRTMPFRSSCSIRAREPLSVRHRRRAGHEPSEGEDISSSSRSLRQRGCGCDAHQRMVSSSLGSGSVLGL